VFAKPRESRESPAGLPAPLRAYCAPHAASKGLADPSARPDGTSQAIMVSGVEKTSAKPDEELGPPTGVDLQ
jgi:hypothetical protein